MGKTEKSAVENNNVCRNQCRLELDTDIHEGLSLASLVKTW